MVLTQFSFLFLFLIWGEKKQHKNRSFFSHFVTAGYQSISIHGTVMIAHVVRGPNLIGLHFSTVFHIGKKRYLYGEDCQHMIVQLSLIKPGNNDCIYTRLRLTDFTIKITQFLLGFPHQYFLPSISFFSPFLINLRQYFLHVDHIYCNIFTKYLLYTKVCFSYLKLILISLKEEQIKEKFKYFRLFN